MIVEFRDAAREELLEATRWHLEQAGPAIAGDFETAVRQALQLLLRMPLLGTPCCGHARLWPLRRHPYTLVYRVQGQRLSVLAVAHQSRAPGYWRRRDGTR